MKIGANTGRGAVPVEVTILGATLVALITSSGGISSNPVFVDEIGSVARQHRPCDATFGLQELHLE